MYLRWPLIVEIVLNDKKKAQHFELIVIASKKIYFFTEGQSVLKEFEKTHHQVLSQNSLKQFRQETTVSI